MKLSYPWITKTLFKARIILSSQVSEELKRWSDIASQAADEISQAAGKDAILLTKASIIEGCAPIMALKSSPSLQSFFPVTFIAAYKVLFTYLENYCNKAKISDYYALFTLYNSLEEAINCDIPITDYYALCHNKNDGGLLNGLVKACRSQIQILPLYSNVKDLLIKYTRTYIDLQITKLSNKNDLSKSLSIWSKAEQKKFTLTEVLNWWEFCAAIDNQTIIPILFILGANKEITKANVEKLLSSFFPWVSGFIKMLELMVSYHYHDENQYIYINHYSNLKEVEQKLIYFYSNALAALSKLDEALSVKYLDVIGLQADYLFNKPGSKWGMNKLAYINIIEHIKHNTIFSPSKVSSANSIAH